MVQRIYLHGEKIATFGLTGTVSKSASGVPLGSVRINGGPRLIPTQLEITNHGDGTGAGYVQFNNADRFWVEGTYSQRIEVVEMIRGDVFVPTESLQNVEITRAIIGGNEVVAPQS